MKKLLSILGFLLSDSGMASFDATNYKESFTDKGDKYPKGELAGRKRVLMDNLAFTAGAPLLNGDTINLGSLPKDSKVLDARIKITTGGATTGILDLGNKANETGDAQDQDSLIQQADAGGQNVLEAADNGSAAIFKRYDSETQLFLTCTEDFDNSCEIEVEITYTND